MSNFSLLLGIVFHYQFSIFLILIHFGFFHRWKSHLVLLLIFFYNENKLLSSEIECDSQNDLRISFCLYFFVETFVELLVPGPKLRRLKYDVKKTLVCSDCSIWQATVGNFGLEPKKDLVGSVSQDSVCSLWIVKINNFLSYENLSFSVYNVVKFPIVLVLFQRNLWKKYYKKTKQL